MTPTPTVTPMVVYPSNYVLQFGTGTSTSSIMASVIDGGHTYIVGTYANQGYIAKLTNDGGMMWQLVLGGSILPYIITTFNSITVLGDYIYVVGLFCISSPASVDAVLIKLDKNGVIQFQKLWSISTGSSIEEITKITNDGTYLYVCGNIDGKGCLGKINTSGGMIWLRKFGGGNDIGRGVAVSATNVYVLTNSGYLMKFDLDGILVTQIHNMGTYSGATISCYGRDLQYDGSHLLVSLETWTSAFAVPWSAGFFVRYSEDFVLDFNKTIWAGGSSAGQWHSGYSVKPYGSEYLVAGSVKFRTNSSCDDYTGSLVTVTSGGAYSPTIPVVRFRFNKASDNGTYAQSFSWKDVQYNGNIVLSGSYVGWDGSHTTYRYGLFLVNVDDKASMSGAVNVPLSDLEITQLTWTTRNALTTNGLTLTVTDITGTVNLTSSTPSGTPVSATIVGAEF
jgi:hypothetical protein